MAACPDGAATLTAAQNRDIPPKCKIWLYFLIFRELREVFWHGFGPLRRWPPEFGCFAPMANLAPKPWALTRPPANFRPPAPMPCWDVFSANSDRVRPGRRKTGLRASVF